MVSKKGYAKRAAPAEAKPLVIQDANKLLDTVSRLLAVESDAELCKLIHIDPSYLSKIRRRNRRIGKVTLLRLHHATGLPVPELQNLIEERDPNTLPLPVDKRTTRPTTVGVNRTKPPATRSRYSDEFKLSAVRRVAKGNLMTDVAADMRVPLQTLSNWCKAWNSGGFVVTRHLTVAEIELIARLCQDRHNAVTTGRVDGSRDEVKLLKGLSRKLKIGSSGENRAKLVIMTGGINSEKADFSGNRPCLRNHAS